MNAVQAANLFGSISPKVTQHSLALPLIKLRHAMARAAANGNPHSKVVMASPPTITTTLTAEGAPSTATELTQAFRYSAGTQAIRFVGGGDQLTSTFYRRFPVATQAATGGNTGANNGALANSWKAGVVVTSSKVAFRVFGSTAPYRFIVDGQYVSLTGTTPANTTNTRGYIVHDYGSRATRTVHIEGDQSQGLDGIFVAPNDVVIPAPAPSIRAISLGDSYSTATGATFQGDGFFPIMCDYLGIGERWCAGVGGTGYIDDVGGTRYTLSQRLDADLNRMLAYGDIDVVVVPMGYNDIGDGSVLAAANNVFDRVRAKCPYAVVLVVGPWDTAAPSATITGYSSTKTDIITAVGNRAGFYFIDIEGLAYTKSGDAVHPDDTGHATIGQGLNTRIRAALDA